jgi:hypothetical protein
MPASFGERSALMYWYNPTTRTSERAAAPADDEGAVRMLAGHPDSAAFVTEYAELRRSGAPIERALVTVGHRERLRRHEHATLWLASSDRPTKPRPSAEGYELLLAARLREKGEGHRLLGRPVSRTPSKNVAVVEGGGAILAVNGGWRAFARENGGDSVKVSEGANYLAVCDGARGDQSGCAAAFAEGLRAVLAGRERNYKVEYPCHSPTERRWYVGSARPLEFNGTRLAVVTHENSTASTLP